MNNPVTSVYSTNLFHGTAGLLLAQYIYYTQRF